MSIISKLVESQTVDASNIEDYSGSSFVTESGFYENKIKRAWVIESKGGAIGIHVEFEGEGILDRDIWMTNKEQQVFYTRNGKDVAMAGYVEMKKLNYVATGNFLTSLTGLNVSQQIVKTHEWVEDTENEGKKKKVDVEKEVEYITDWAGKELIVGIQMKEKEESVKQGDKWVGTGKRAEDKDGKPYLDAEVIGYYDIETKRTANELKKDAESTQYDKDVARIEKSPIRVFKAKKGSPSSKPSTGASGAVKRPSVFAPIGLQYKAELYAC